MTKLAVVRSALKAHPSAVIVAERSMSYLPDCGRQWGMTVEFFIAPKAGLYKAEALQTFMLALIPGLAPTAVVPFEEKNNSLEFGRLTFDEAIGHVSCHREISLTVDDLPDLPDFVDGKRVISEESDIGRRVWVSVFPDLAAAENALRGVHVYSVSKTVLPPRNAN